MRTAAVAFLLALVCSTLVTPLVRKLAHRFGALDHGLSARKMHGRPIPRLGGVAIVVGFYAPLLALFIFRSDVGSTFLAEHNLALGTFVGGLVIFILGVYDDIRGADARKKFAVQFAAAALMYGVGFRIDQIATPFGGVIQLGWLSLPITVVWIVGIVNAMNLIDGLDGLAGGVAMFALLTIFAVSAYNGQPLQLLFSAALGGAVLGFLFYNFNPASIFMGDSGSMFLGFILSTVSIRTGHKSSTAVALLIPLAVLGLPILDTLLAMTRRAVRGQPLFHADKEHIHHRLLARGFTHMKTVLLLYGFCAVLCGTALTLSFFTGPLITVSLMCIVAVGLAAFLRTLGYARNKLSGYRNLRRNSISLQVSLRPLSLALRDARTPSEAWHVIKKAAPVLGADYVQVALMADTIARSLSATLFQGAEVSEPPRVEPMFRSRFIISHTKLGSSYVEVGWMDGRDVLERQLELAIELLCLSLTSACGRFTREPERGPSNLQGDSDS